MSYSTGRRSETSTPGAILWVLLAAAGAIDRSRNCVCPVPWPGHINATLQSIKINCFMTKLDFLTFQLNDKSLSAKLLFSN